MCPRRHECTFGNEPGRTRARDTVVDAFNPPTLVEIKRVPIVFRQTLKPMNRLSSSHRAILAGIIGALVLRPSAHAQSNGKSSSSPVLDVVTAHASALTLFAQGDIVNAQKVLFSSNVNQGTSPEADFESGQHLASLALSFYTRRDQTHAAQTANLALP